MYTLYNVCSVHQGLFSISGGYHEYIGGYQEVVFCSVTEHNMYTLYNVYSVHRGLFSTSWISWVHRGDIMSTSGGIS